MKEKKLNLKKKKMKRLNRASIGISYTCPALFKFVFLDDDDNIYK